MQSPKAATEVAIRHFEIDDRLKQNLAYPLPKKFPSIVRLNRHLTFDLPEKIL